MDCQEDSRTWKFLPLDRCKPHQPLKDFPVTDNHSAAQSEPGPEETGSTAGTAIDTTVPHSARVWNYWLGGKDNYKVDRVVAGEVAETFPAIIGIARQARLFLFRAIRYLVVEAGVRQFLDIGTGLPTANNTHEIAQGMVPQARIVYVDNDPLVLVHARALLTSSPEGATDYVQADVRDPERILREAARTLDFAQPIGLMMLGILGQIPDSDNPQAIVSRLLDPLPSGSYLVIDDGTNTDPVCVEAMRAYNQNPGSASRYHLRSPEQITRFFDGLELVEPGVVSTPQWRPESSPWGEAVEIADYAGVGRKP
jgi:S-adenosyl methyltransferase